MVIDKIILLASLTAPEGTKSAAGHRKFREDLLSLFTATPHCIVVA